MKRLPFLLVITILFLISNFKAQDLSSIPEGLSKKINTPVNQTPTVTGIYEAFMSMDPLINDSIRNHEYIKAARWISRVFSKYNIEDSVTYSLTDYSNAVKAIYNSPFHCGDEDKANWQSQGPRFMPDWNGPGGRKQQNGGWTNSIYNDPNDLNTFLIGTNTSGIFRTTNGGLNWNNVTDDENFPVLGVNRIIPAPDNPDYLLAITGTNFIDGGIIYSDDRGVSWNEFSQQSPHFNWIDYHPTIDGLVFATGKNDIYFSQDYGQSWNSLLAPTLEKDNEYDKIIVFENNIFVTTYDHFSLNTELLKGDLTIAPMSANWQDITALTTDSPTDELSFADFSNKVGERFYLQVQINGGANKIFKSINSGDNFIETPINILGGMRFKNELIASVNDVNSVYWGSLRHMRKYNDNTGSFIEIASHPTNNGHHDDYRSSYIVNDNGKDRLSFGNDGGPALVKDGLNTSPLIETLNGDLSINLIHAFHVHEPTKRIVYNFQDHAMRYKDIDETYSSTFIWEGSAAMIQDNYPLGIVGENAMTTIRDAPFSTNPIVEPSFAAGRLSLGAYFVTYRHHPERFARGIRTGNGINNGGVALNRAKNVSEVSEITTSRSIGAVAICERNTNYIYAAEFSIRGAHQLDSENKLYRSEDDGQTWTSLSSATVTLNDGTYNLSQQLAWNGIRAIAVDHIDPSVVYCGIGSTHKHNNNIVDERFRVIKSTDKGNSFIDFSEGLPALPVERLLTIESSQNLIFCATSVGIYYRMDGMNQWECFSENLPMTEITGMQYDYCAKELYVSTYGRGMWKTPVPFEISSSYQQEITGTETWNDVRILKEDLVIKSGGSLTITDIVKVAYDKKIIVEPGGRLIVDGGILTNYCNDLWQGIEVWGNNQANQSTANQGFLQLKNNAVIENARTAVAVWKRNDYTSSGGIVMASNSTFKNNWRSVEYISYHNFFTTSNNEMSNKGLLSNCEFIWDDDYEALAGTDIGPAITLWDIFGVRIQGCDFIDNRSYITKLNDRTVGVFSIDAGYRVIGRRFIGSLLSPQPTEYDETEYDVGQFINMREGIRATNSSSQANVIVDHCKFLNSHIGVNIRGVDNSMVTRNLFSYTADHPNEISSMFQLGIVEATDYMVEGNHFMNDVNGASVLGALVMNTGVEQNVIYKNKYDGVFTGNYAFGKNTNDLSGTFSTSGLQWKCNEYNNFKYDQYVFSFNSSEGDGNGVRLKQGTNLNPAGNTFTNTFDSQQNEFHFTTNDQDNLIYYAYDNQPEIPTELAGNVGVHILGFENACETNFNTVITGVAGNILNEGKKQNLKSEFLTINQELSQRISELDSLEEAANTSNLFNLVDNLQPNNKQQLRSSLETASPYLSTELLMYVGNKTNPEYPPSWFKDLILMNIEVAQDNSFMNYLKTKDSPLPQGLYNQIDNVRNQSITSRGEKLNKIISLDTKKSNIIRLLITNELSDTTAIDWTEYNELVTLRKDLFCRAQHADEFLGRKQVQQCDTKLDEIHSNLSDYLIASTQQEMEDFYTFKKYLLSISNSSGVLEGLTDDQVDELLIFSEELTGRAQVQAQNLLCFFAGICEDLFVEYAPIAKSMSQESSSEKELAVEQPNEIKVVPNPNQGEFEVKLKEAKEIKNIEVFGADGKRLTFKSTNSNSSSATIQIKDPTKGVYWIKVTTQNGDYHTTKFVIR